MAINPDVRRRYIRLQEKAYVLDKRLGRIAAAVKEAKTPFISRNYLRQEADLLKSNVKKFTDAINNIPLDEINYESMQHYDVIYRGLAARLMLLQYGYDTTDWN